MHYKTATVFGGTGFVGRYVVDQLTDAGIRVRVVTRRLSSAYFLRTAGAVGQVVSVVCDLQDDRQVAAAICGSDFVINLVGALVSRRGKSSFCALHHQFPERLARWATAANVQRLVHVSSLSADRNAPSRYGTSKAKGETALLGAFPAATILRPSVIFGPEDNFFNRFARMAGVAPFLPLIGGGQTKFQPVYVGDVARAIHQALVLPHDDVQGKIFALGGPDVFSFKQLLEKMASYTGVHKKLLPVPFALAKIKGAVLQNLPGAPLTIDQVRNLTVDNVLHGDLPGLAELHITPTALDTILPSYLQQYRPGGLFTERRAGQSVS